VQNSPGKANMNSVLGNGGTSTSTSTQATTMASTKSNKGKHKGKPIEQ